MTGTAGYGASTRGDRLAGERAPAGPKYTRTGAVRQSWNDPLGFVGLAKVQAPAGARRLLTARVEALRGERASVQAEADDLAGSLRGLDLEVQALAGTSGIDGYRKRRSTELRESEARLASLRVSVAELQSAIAAGEAWLAGPESEWHGDPRAHLSHAAAPEPPDRTNRRVFAETWAALSVGVLVIALAVILWFHLLPVVPALVVLGAGYLAIESFAQRQVETLLLRIVVLLAIVAAVLLAIHYLRELVLVGLVALGLFILVDNLREIRRR